MIGVDTGSIVILGEDLLPPVGTKAGSYTLFGLLVMGFFWVCGGCYGMEELFSVAPPSVVLPCLLLVPFFYSLPLALMTTELTAAMPFDGGLVREKGWGWGEGC
jgi:hypothetical protein